NIRSLSDVFGINVIDLNNSRQIVGNNVAGYKVAICQRDIMIYFALMLFATIFHISKKRIKKIHFLLWILFAITPIAVDGIWQLFSTINMLNIPAHESTPLIRSITGAMFGYFSGWYLLPAIQDTFNDANEGNLTSI
ncbi:MAG: DUF2085 domain-containing protein, partial [Pelolinea sp.]|nr:DUF2085 domain-containing protein [Pelolinea sp.]